MARYYFTVEYSVTEGVGPSVPLVLRQSELESLPARTWSV